MNFRSTRLPAIVAVVLAIAVQVWLVYELRGLRRELNDLQGTVGALTGRQGRMPAPLPEGPVSLDGAAMRGNPRARVALIEYSDFECPYCVTFVKRTLPQLEEAYVKNGKMLFAFRHLPLTSIHQGAFRAAEAAECAGRQGRFWAMHDMLFADPRKLNDEGHLRTYAQTAALDLRAYDTCMRGVAADAVRQSISAARTLAVNSTPTFFIGTLTNLEVHVLHRLSGAQSIERFRAFIDPLLATPK